MKSCSYGVCLSFPSFPDTEAATSSESWSGNFLCTVVITYFTIVICNGLLNDCGRQLHQSCFQEMTFLSTYLPVACALLGSKHLNYWAPTVCLDGFYLLL